MTIGSPANGSIMMDDDPAITRDPSIHLNPINSRGKRIINCHARIFRRFTLSATMGNNLLILSSHTSSNLLFCRTFIYPSP
ncbi:MAG: hypothetical protein A2788_01235 [Candidatus Abawacabacteria bacterium RIFCSPHIGHO2_01_FULL_46_8]|uniref:Uncharacterized protein n=1 Tax=Candidatus Abawacabacteria bacterium RIFCSPHIGHO2_01_FULL_46_8 TaxID=1817815 RepID=A0A1F4XHK9_9BACT|nr:MAG: hypothetical protein A2788_01235 [Candidatus Abawacabacteria bacterium RIFCSPHIGHO2_01_FULL_46_8]